MKQIHALMGKQAKQIAYLRFLILSCPDDIKLLKKEYRELTGKRFYRKRGE